METELHNLQQACTEHNGNCQKECKFCRYCSGYAQKQRTNNGCTRTGCTRENSCDELEYPNQKSKLECDFFQTVDTRLFSFMACFNNKKRNTKNDQCNGNSGIVVKQCLKLLIKQQPNDRRWYTGNQNLQPQHDNIHTQIRNQTCTNPSGIIRRFLERENGIPEYYHNCQNSTKLDDHLKHTVKFF